MIRLNSQLKKTMRLMLSLTMFSWTANLYRSMFSKYELNLNDLYIDLNFNNKIEQKDKDYLNPFELIEGFNKEIFLINRIKIALYNPPLTNKLYPKSNLYGHELIRYFDK